MTVIAFDGETLAGDRQTTHEGTPSSTRKVFKIRGLDGGRFLIGCAGDTGDCVQYRRWATGSLKETPALTDIVVISIDEKKRIWCATQKMHWYQIGIKFWAVGSGANYALGAMAAGKTARQAVAIAMKLDVYCGLGIDAVRF